MSKDLRILTVASISATQLEEIMGGLARQFDVRVEADELAFDLERAFDRTRNQYLSAALLRQLSTITGPASPPKIVGITDVDLFAPILTFVFGEAQLNGACAVLSTFRLQNAFYGIPPDPKKLTRRIVKEVIHETGHLFGLTHCPLFDCVMRSSTYVEEIDLKTDRLCPQCNEKLQNS
jgi:archaemetzincin